MGKVAVSHIISYNLPQGKEDKRNKKLPHKVYTKIFSKAAASARYGECMFYIYKRITKWH